MSGLAEVWPKGLQCLLLGGGGMGPQGPGEPEKLVGGVQAKGKWKGGGEGGGGCDEVLQAEGFTPWKQRTHV